MKKWFHMDAPVMRMLVLVTNLVFLNLLWLLCCLPIVTAGAATAAMYHVVFQYLTDQDDAVVKPYFYGFRQNFKQSTLFWIPLCLLAVILVFDALYLVANYPGRFHPLWLAFVVVVAVWVMLMIYAFPLIARFQSTGRDILRNSFLLFLMHPVYSVLCAALHAIPVLMLLFAPSLFFTLGLLWFGLGFAFIFYWSGKLLLAVFGKHLNKEMTNERLDGSL